MLGHEGKGSLLSALKEKGWSNSLLAGKRAQARGFDFFTVYVDLTEDGLLHIDDIIELVFQYINMINKEGAVKWIFDVRIIIYQSHITKILLHKIIRHTYSFAGINRYCKNEF